MLIGYKLVEREEEITKLEGQKKNALGVRPEETNMLKR
jgi:hypothetical protein